MVCLGCREAQRHDQFTVVDEVVRPFFLFQLPTSLALFYNSMPASALHLSERAVCFPAIEMVIQVQESCTLPFIDYMQVRTASTPTGFGQLERPLVKDQLI